MTRAVYIAVLLAGCMLGGGQRTVTAFELRSAVVGLNLASLDPNTRGAIERGDVWPGETEAQLYVSRGEPRLWWNTQLGANACRVLVHQGPDPALAEVAVTTCSGVVVQATAIKPALPCWRLAEVGPRIAAAADYFETRPLLVQWQIVIGLLHRGQAQRDVTIAFGDPHNRGFDEREDGRRAEQLVFLDRSGDAYGLSVTLIDDKVVGWKMPAERRLTPEAEQRRLDALEKRLTAKLAELEKLAIRQHAETVKLFGDVMARQEEMLGVLTQPPQALPASASVEAGSSPGASLSSDSSSTIAGGAKPATDATPPTDAKPPTVAAGTCRCKGWPLGTDKKKAKTPREERCQTMRGEDASSCDTACKASGYAIGLFRGMDSCD